MVLAYVIAGPIFNLTYNAKEVVRTFACTTQLTYNLTKTRLDLMFKPFQQAIFKIKSDANEMQDTLASVRDLSSPIVGEIEGEEEMRRLREENDYFDDKLGDTKRSEEIEERKKHEESKKQADTSSPSTKSEADVYEERYREKIEERCEEQLTRGAERCREMFSSAYDKCYDKVSVFAAWLLCWPMKLTFVCNLAQAMGGSSTCDPDGKVDTGIGEGYAALKEFRTWCSVLP